MTNQLYGPDGEQFNIYSTQRWPLGTLLQMQDGRAFRFAKAGASALVIGDLIQAAANVANDVGRTGIATAAGSRAPTLTTGGAVTANFYAEGYWNTSVTPGGGESRKIDNHLAGTTATVYNLAPGHSIGTTITTTSRIDLIKNPYDAVIQIPVTTTTGAPVGVAVSVIAATTGCGWIQTKGMAAVLTSGTVILGSPANNIQVAGSVGPPENTTVATLAKQHVVGIVQRVAASGAWSSILLSLE